MFGHSPAPVARAIAEQATRGLTAMLPSPDAVWVAEELARRFGLSHWQFAISASDANRFALRWLRAASGRGQIVVFNGCYHGTVDDVFVDLIDGQPRRRASLLGQVHDLAAHTRVVEFNDLEALELALRDEQVACVLAEPVMTNIGMVMPEPGFWRAAQDLIRRYGSYLLLDETHTISSGPGGYGAAYGEAGRAGAGQAAGRRPAVRGVRLQRRTGGAGAARQACGRAGHSGIGTTLSGNMLASAAMRANLAEVMSDAAYQRMFALAQHLADGLLDWIGRWRLPWCVSRVGARCEFQFSPRPPRNGGEAGAMQDEELERIIHLYLLNRGFLITPSTICCCYVQRPSSPMSIACWRRWTASPARSFSAGSRSRGLLAYGQQGLIAQGLQQAELFWRDRQRARQAAVAVEYAQFALVQDSGSSTKVWATLIWRYQAGMCWAMAGASISSISMSALRSSALRNRLSPLSMSARSAGSSNSTFRRNRSAPAAADRPAARADQRVVEAQAAVHGFQNDAQQVVELVIAQ